MNYPKDNHFKTEDRKLLLESFIACIRDRHSVVIQDNARLRIEMEELRAQTKQSIEASRNLLIKQRRLNGNITAHFLAVSLSRFVQHTNQTLFKSRGPSK